MHLSRDEQKSTVPIVVGAVSLDIIEYAAGDRIVARFGGVSHNVARALAALEVPPIFLSPRYVGELGKAVASQLTRTGINWRPLAKTAPLAAFFARVDADGALGHFRFVDNEAFTPLTGPALTRASGLLTSWGPVVACTDLSVEALQVLRDVTYANGVPLWLVASDAITATKATAIQPLADVVCLNSDELTAVSECADDDQSLAAAAGRLIGDDGVAVITLGEHGSLLVNMMTGNYLRQQPTTLVVRPSLGAGDVLAGSLLSNRLAGRDWPEALARSTVTAEQFVSAGDALFPAFDRIEEPASNPAPSQAFEL